MLMQIIFPPAEQSIAVMRQQMMWSITIVMLLRKLPFFYASVHWRAGTPRCEHDTVFGSQWSYHVGALYENYGYVVLIAWPVVRRWAKAAKTMIFMRRASTSQGRESKNIYSYDLSKSL